MLKTLTVGQVHSIITIIKYVQWGLLSFSAKKHTWIFNFIVISLFFRREQQKQVTSSDFDINAKYSYFRNEVIIFYISTKFQYARGTLIFNGPLIFNKLRSGTGT